MPSFDLKESRIGKYFSSMAELGIIRIFIEYRIFDLITDNGISVSDVSKKLDMDYNLLDRFSTFLIAAGVISSPAPGMVALMPASKIFQDPQASLFYSYLYDVFMGPTIDWREYFKRNGLAEPKRSNRTPAGLSAGQPDKSAYELAAMPEDGRQLNDAMALEGDIPVTGIYDFDWVAKYADSPGAPSSRMLIVDVGGGKGQALKAIIESAKIPAARCVLQDRPQVIPQATEEAKGGVLGPVKKIGRSFFDDQQIQGALVYYIRRVLNDWPDDEAVQILTRIRAACAEDSRVLINEYLRPSEPSLFVSTIDMFCMNVGGKVRDERMFQEIASRAGLKVSSVYKDGKTNSAVIEMVPN